MTTYKTIAAKGAKGGVKWSEETGYLFSWNFLWGKASVIFVF
jgi:hypothetical protein